MLKKWRKVIDVGTLALTCSVWTLNSLYKSLPFAFHFSSLLLLWFKNNYKFNQGRKELRKNYTCNTKMTPIGFTSTVLLGFLFIMLALGNSAADTHHDEIRENKLRPTTGGINPGSIDQDHWDGVPTAAAAPAVWNGKLGGRKMLAGNVLSKEMMMVMKQEGQMNNGEEASSSAKISGKSKIASAQSIGSSQTTTTTDFQNYSKKQLGPKATLNSVDNKKTESQQKLFDEVANLLLKDYHNSNPRRKPPINNYMPLDEDDVKP